VTDRIDKAGLVVSAALLLLVLELVRRKKLSEEFSFLWVAGALAVLGISLRRDLLDRTALWLGVYYPPSLLLLVLLVVVFIGSLTIFVVLSRHRSQIERLIEDSAIISAELRELREQAAGSAPQASDAIPGSKPAGTLTGGGYHSDRRPG
jgi:hypothetical protein